MYQIPSYLDCLAAIDSEISELTGALVTLQNMRIKQVELDVIIEKQRPEGIPKDWIASINDALPPESCVVGWHAPFSYSSRYIFVPAVFKDPFPLGACNPVGQEQPKSTATKFSDTCKGLL